MRKAVIALSAAAGTGAILATYYLWAKNPQWTEMQAFRETLPFLIVLAVSVVLTAIMLKESNGS